MRILYLGNNLLGCHVLEHLKATGEDVVGLVLHPHERRSYGAEMIEASGLGEASIFDGSRLRQAETLEAIADLKPDIGISVLFGYILKEEFLTLLPEGCVNLHPALLPYNRGSYPNVWSIVDNTPAGVTLHYIDVGIDTGDIIAQREVAVEPVDTGETLYRKLEKTALELFTETWPLVASGNAKREPQPRENGTYHRVKDVREIDRIDLDGQYTARHLINVLRARSFPPYPGAYIEVDGQRVYLRLQLMRESEMETPP
ncbi:MAG: methionyl-tRNA formyltransferase [Chloroflexi bacterium]|nr:methionyl-tRNA formyltransferase [Chloroflexota bacterium]